MRIKGRMLSWRISRSVRVNALSGPWPMLLYTWLIPHVDNLGRLNGEPSEVRGLVLPKQNISDRQVESWLGELRDAGLVLWYEVESLRYVAIPPDVWSREQTLHHNMSRTSDFPPPPEHLRTMYGAPPDNVRPEGEGKGEGEGKEHTSPPDGGGASDDPIGKTSLKADWLEAFDKDFYPDYPRKVKPDAARRAWLAIKPWNQTTCNTIFAGLERWKSHWTENETEARYIPHPASFLNSGQWKGGP